MSCAFIILSQCEKMKADFDDCKLVECLHVQNKPCIFSNKSGPDFPGNMCRLCSPKECMGSSSMLFLSLTHSHIYKGL